MNCECHEFEVLIDDVMMLDLSVCLYARNYGVAASQVGACAWNWYARIKMFRRAAW